MTKEFMKLLTNEEMIEMETRLVDTIKGLESEAVITSYHHYLIKTHQNNLITLRTVMEDVIPHFIASSSWVKAVDSFIEEMRNEVI